MRGRNGRLGSQVAGQAARVWTARGLPFTGNSLAGLRVQSMCIGFVVIACGCGLYIAGHAGWGRLVPDSGRRNDR